LLHISSSLTVSQTSLALAICIAISGCASSPSMTGKQATDAIPAAGEKYQITPSYLDEPLSQDDNEPGASGRGQTEVLQQAATASELITQDQLESDKIKRLSALPREQVQSFETAAGQAFDNKQLLSVAVNDMPLKSFLNYVFGELLSVDYVIDPKLPDGNMTLNVGNKVTAQRLFELTQQVLMQQAIGLRFVDGIYYVYPVEKGQKTSVVMGFGRSVSAVPNNAGDILQVVPLKYGVKGNIQRIVGGLIEASISIDFEQGVMFIQGEREQIVRGLELIQLLDVPSNRGRFISMISPTYLSVDELVKAVTELLKTEGIDVATQGQVNGSLLFVPLTQLGAMTVFAADQDILNRVEYWVSQIDKPSQSTEKQYHVYTPRFARASDLGSSISPLITGNAAPSAQKPSAKEDKESAEIARNPAPQTSSVSSNDDMSMVVDERSNSLIFYSSGREYQAILPLIRRMDILPKQVLLNVTIAEVKLTGAFKRGFEFALTSGKFGASTKGALGLNDIAGLSLGWAAGAEEILGKFVDENSQVNILSKPSLLVRDGTEASINVGDKIPVSSGSSSSGSGDVITENISYRETGIKLTVTPTVNAQGVVIMMINQEISNQLEGQGKGGNPIFFERSINTEVVAESGQTILLGGLISEDSNNGNTGVPFLKSIPLLGALFEQESKTNTKTELVILMTPKIVERSSQWQAILNQYERALTNIAF
jgi:general secretion pathway protein D